MRQTDFDVVKRMSEHQKSKVWSEFCISHSIFHRSVPLFDADETGRVFTLPFGVDGRLLLQKSHQMRDLIITTVERVLLDPWPNGEMLEGIIYMMLWHEEPDQVIPLYIGRAGKHGKSGGNISANLLNIRNNANKFARWGSGYAYHIGDLSAASCIGHLPSRITPKYVKWANRLFQDAPCEQPMLYRPTYFWTTAWGPFSQSIWLEYGPTSLSFQEYLLIGVASDLFPGFLLNDEGVNKGGPHHRKLGSSMD